MSTPEGYREVLSVPMNVAVAPDVTIFAGDGENFIARTVPTAALANQYPEDTQATLTLRFTPVDPDPAIRTQLLEALDRKNAAVTLEL